MAKQLVFITGLPGSGKSTFAIKLGSMLNKTVMDIDLMIESHYGKNIQSIWEDVGETSFRDTERKIINKLLESIDDGVVALGGGSLHHNKELFEKSGAFIILLETDFNILCERIWSDMTSGKNSRPMFKECTCLDEVCIKLAKLQIERLEDNKLATVIVKDTTEVNEIVRNRIKLSCV